MPKLLLQLFALMLASASAHPVPDSPQWLTYPGGDGPGKGKHIVLIAADQEYRSEQSMPMLAKILSTHHGFDCTVLFAVNDKGEVDPTMPVYPEKGKEAEFKTHHIPGLEHLASADLIVKGINGAIGAKKVTYDFARLMEGATEIKCSEFGTAMIEHM